MIALIEYDRAMFNGIERGLCSDGNSDSAMSGWEERALCPVGYSGALCSTGYNAPMLLMIINMIETIRDWTLEPYETILNV